MAYVRDTDPLPPNSEMPSSACGDWGKCLQGSMAVSVANARAASAMAAGPSSFRSFGPALVIDVARSQNERAAAGVAAPPSQPVNVAQEMASAPTVLPLNVSEAEYSGCSIRGTGALLPIPIAPQRVTMPPMMPAPVVVPEVAAAPRYSNLCWALRNGAVDVSQFDPTEYAALSYRCTTLGYAGACTPPPNVALWLNQQRRAGTLPHISVPASMLDGIPQAPDLTGKSCPESWALAGMAGYGRRRGRRGLGAPWGDAGSMPSTAGWPGAAGSSVSNGWLALLFFGAVGVGLYVMAGSNGSR
jgi:hypothetical protein